MVTETTGIDGLAAMKAALDRRWKAIFAENVFVHRAARGEISRSLYALYMHETYHYTRHNARNQALVGVMGAGDDAQYQKFCFEHAAEEAGHEHMALHDMRSLDRSVELELAPPLRETTVLIAYLYWVSVQGNPVQRLGYSYWAESCYEYILPMVGQVQKQLGLSEAQMTFFISHAKIDVEHAEEVRAMLARTCRTPEDWATATEVMETSLDLTAGMMRGVCLEYDRLARGETKRADFVLRYDA